MKTASAKNRTHGHTAERPSEARERPIARRVRRRTGAPRKDSASLRAFLEALKTPALLCLSDGTIIQANKSFEEMSGFTDRRFNAGQQWISFLREDMHLSPSLPVTGLPEGHLCQLVDRKGKKRNGLLSALPAPESGRLLVTFTETAPAAQTGDAWEGETEAFRSVLEKAPYGVLIRDGGGRNLYINQEFTTITGYTLEDIPLTRDWLRRAYPKPQYRRSVLAAWLRDGGTATERSFRVLCKSGEEKEIEFKTARLDHERFVIMLSDVTSRLATERALREREQRFRALFERSEDAIILYDGRVIVDANPAALKLLQYDDRSKIINLRPSDLSPERQPDGSLSTLKAREVTKLGRNSPLRFEWVHKRIDGSELPVEVVFTPIMVEGMRIFHCVLRDMSEVKRNEESLRFAQFAVERARDSIFWTDKGGKLLYVNDAACQRSGYSREELLSMSVLNLDPNFTQQSWNEHWDLKRLRGSTILDSNHCTKDGIVYPVEVSSSYLNYEGKEFACAIVRDMTGRKETEDALRESESKFRALAERAPVGVYLVQDNVFQYVNPSFAHIHGYEVDDLAGSLKPPMIIYPEDIPRVKEGINKRLSGEIDSLHTEFRTIRKDGAVISVEAYGSRITYRGRPAVIGTLIDITKRKEAERALKESEERFRRLFEQNEEPLIIFHAESARILDANPAVLDLYGFDRKTLTARGPSLFFSRSDLKGFKEALLGVRKTGSFMIEDAVTRAKDGSQVRVKIRGKSIRLSDVDVVYCTFRDITEQTRLEQEASLLHSKLIHANKMTSLGVLVSSVAHEVNNPNNFIMFNASLLADAWTDALRIMKEYGAENGEFYLGGLPFEEMQDAVGKLLQGITEGSRRIKGIVDNLKDFARQDHAGLDDKVDMNNVVTGAQAFLAGQIKKYTSSFSLDLGTGLPHVKGSFQQLEQVIINLLMNALQALPGKERGVRVSTLLDPLGTDIRIEVSDEGVGMSREVMKRITEPFFTTKLDSGGTGLGLSISYSIIKDHRGTMDFRSEPGRGTTVVITLPVFHNLSRND